MVIILYDFLMRNVLTAKFQSISSKLHLNDHNILNASSMKSFKHNIMNLDINFCHHVLKL